MPLFSSLPWAAVPDPHVRGGVGHHLVEIRGQDDARAAIVGGGNLVAEVGRGESAGAGVQLRVQLLEECDVVGEHHLMGADQSVGRVPGVGRRRGRCQGLLIEHGQLAMHIGIGSLGS